MNRTGVLAAVFLGSVLVAVVAHAADASKPHAHRGVLKPYSRPPAAIKLSPAELSLLAANKPVLRTAESGDAGGRGISIARVHAPPDVTWAVINDWKSYPKFLDEVKKIEVYKKDGGIADVRFDIASFGVSLTYFIHHDFNMAERWGTWTLDYNKESDLDDSVGFWRVVPVDGQPEWSQVEYSVDISLKGWVPGFIRSLLVDNGLKTATGWVRVHTEKRFQKMQETDAKAAAAAPAPAAPAPTAPVSSAPAAPVPAATPAPATAVTPPAASP